MKRLKFLWTICALMFLTGVSEAWAGSKTVYIRPGVNWTSATQRFSLYMYNSNEDKAWAAFSSDGCPSGIYKATFNDAYNYMIICRMNGATDFNSSNDWGNKWNQTSDLDAPYADELLYDILGEGEGHWDTSGLSINISPYELNDETTYYLYNVGAAKFLCSGNAWGSHASVGEGGIPITLTPHSGTYKLSTSSIYSGKYVHRTSNATSVFMDSGDITYWAFERVSDNTYKIKDNDDKTKFLYWNNGDTYVFNGSDPGTTASQWKLYTESELKANLADATKNSPKDATFLIKNYYFAYGTDMIVAKGVDISESSPSWKGTSLTDLNGNHTYLTSASYAAEQYEKTFDNYQELTVPNGKYHMTAKVLYSTKENYTAIPYIYATSGSNTKKCNAKTKGDGVTDLSSAAQALMGDTYLLDGVNILVTNGSLRVGVKSDANVNWCVFDDFSLIYYGNLLEDVSDNLPNSAVTVGEWYKFTTGSSSDAYTLSSSGDATITYTTDGTLSSDESILTTWSLSAKQNVLLAPSTTYYVKSSAAVTLTKTESSVNSSYVSGWTKVTSISDLQDNPEDYFFAIYSANNTGLMLGASGKYTDTQKPYYKTAANPLSSSAYLFEIENYDGAFVLKSSAIGKYFNNTSLNPWHYHATETSTSSDCKTTASLANGVYTLQTANADGGNNYIGLWTPSNGYKDNEYLAGNKSADDKGSFLIYRIAKSSLNMTSLITNPDFSAATWDTGWTGTGTDKTKAFLNNTNGSFTGTMAEMWVANGGNMSAADLNQTLNELPAGIYTLSAKVQASIDSKLYASINSVDQYLVCNGAVANKSFRFVVNSASDTKIGFKHDGVNPASGDVWEAVDDFQLVYVGDVPSDAQKTALNTAITTAESERDAKTWGFDDGEYAPYTNIASLTAITDASTMYSSSTATAAEVEATTTALGSLSWTANDGEVNAIYDGDFNIQDEHNDAPTSLVGWNDTNLIRRLIKNTTTYPGLTSASHSAAVHVNGGVTMTYGSKTGYTIPLKANTWYELSFKVAGWVDSEMGSFTASVLNGSSQGLSATTSETPTKRVTDENPWTEFKQAFMTGTADNYTLVLTTPSSTNEVITDISLKRANFTISENATYANTLTGSANVTLNRNISSTSTWYSFCVPFAISNTELKAAFGTDVAVAEYTSEANEDGVRTDISFTKMATPAISANTPVLLKASETGSTYNFTGRTLSNSDPKVTGEHGFDFIGTYEDNITLDAGNYFVSSNKLYKSTGKSTLKGTRAYLKAKSAEARIGSFMIDDEVVTNIEGINVSNISQTGKIFNLQGQEVKTLQKGGIYIQNGRKIVTK